MDHKFWDYARHPISLRGGLALADAPRPGRGRAAVAWLAAYLITTVTTFAVLPSTVTTIVAAARD